MKSAIHNSIVTSNWNYGTGGGLSLGGVTLIDHCVFTNNTSLSNGAIFTSGELTIVNSTISGNSAGSAGGLGLNGGTLDLINTSVVYNRSNGGASGINVSESGSVTTNFGARNSIVAYNVSGNPAFGDVYGPLKRGGNVIIGDARLMSVSANVTDVQLNVDPLLDPALTFRGSPIPVHAASTASPVIDRGSNCVLSDTSSGGCVTVPVTMDARGVARPQDGDGIDGATVDIGAFEALRQEVVRGLTIAPDLQASSDSGSSNIDNITSVGTPVFDISGLTIGVTYELRRNGVVVSTGIAASTSLSATDSSAPPDGTYGYTVNQVADGVTGLSSPSLRVRIDRVGPSVTVNQASGQADPVRTLPIGFQVVFSEPAFGFEAGDISFGGSTANTNSAAVSISGADTTFDLTVGNILSDGSVTVAIPAGTVVDVAGNPNPASTSADNSVTYDTTGPSASINQSVSQADPTRVTPIIFSVVFSDPVTGFTSSDVSTSGSVGVNGTPSISISGSGATYTVSISGITSNGGTLRATVNPGAVTDAAGNPSIGSTSIDNLVTLDNTSPTVTINQSASQNDPTGTLPIVFNVIFSESVTGFDAADVNFSGSTVTTTGLTASVSGSGTTYTVSVGGSVVSSGSSIRANVRSSAATDQIGNQSLASTSTDNTVTIDNVSPSVNLNQSIGQIDPTAVQPLSFTAVFSEMVVGFSSEDVSLAGSTAGVSSAVVSVTGSGNVYFIQVSNVVPGGFVRLSIPGGAAFDALGNPNTASVSTDNQVTVRPRNRPFDFDGDGLSDISVFRPSNGQWWAQRSSGGNAMFVSFGLASDQLVPGDFTGDGRTDMAVWRPSTGVWFVLRSENSTFFSVPFGANGDLPVPADFDGDARFDMAVYRPTTQTWYVQNSSGGVRVEQFGAAEDKPVVGDYDGDGKADIAVYRPSLGVWWYLRSSDGGDRAFQFGLSTDIPVTGDFTGDGKADLSLFRSSTGEWFVFRSEDGSYYAFQFGLDGDRPVAADYDGDGKTDPAVFRPASSTWYVQRSAGGIQLAVFGLNGDIPVPASYVR